MICKRFFILVLVCFSSLLPLFAAPSIGGVVNAASFLPGPVAPGTLISVFGTELSSANVGAESIPLPTTLAGSSLTINGLHVPLLFVSPGQINAQIPYGIASGIYSLIVRTQTGQTAQFPVTIGPSSPGVFSWTSDGKGEAVALHANYAQLRRYPGMFASPGDVILVYCTGLGAVSNAPAPGGAGPSGPLAHVLAETKVTLNGVQAQVDFAGLAPGFAGLYQVNVRIPQQLVGTLELVIVQGTAQSAALSISVEGPVSIGNYFVGALGNANTPNILFPFRLTTSSASNPQLGLYGFVWEQRSSDNSGVLGYGTLILQRRTGTPRFGGEWTYAGTTYPVVAEIFEGGVEISGTIGPFSGDPWLAPTRFFARASQPPPPVIAPPPVSGGFTQCSQLNGGHIYGNDGQFLGVINGNRFDLNSIANPYGLYGSRFSATSIFNQFGLYGSPFSVTSAFNKFATSPPILVIAGTPRAYITANEFKIPRVDSYFVAYCVDRLADAPR